jgi:hypothetical protein
MTASDRIAADLAARDARRAQNAALPVADRIAADNAARMTKRQAIAEARAEANAIIEQQERIARGWDRGAYRSDDTLRQWTIRETLAMHSAHAFALSAMFAEDAR